MMYQTCLACKDAGTTPEQGSGVTVIYDPRYQRHGTPTMSNTPGWGELSAPGIARLTYDVGVSYMVSEYEHSREVVLVACWWAGLYGPRALRKAWGDWARTAGQHLCYGCIRIDDPPMKGE